MQLLARMWRKQNSCALSGNADWHSHYASSVKVPPKIKNGTTIGPAVPLLGIYPKETKTLTKIPAPHVYCSIILQ